MKISELRSTLSYYRETHMRLKMRQAVWWLKSQKKCGISLKQVNFGVASRKGDKGIDSIIIPLGIAEAKAVTHSAGMDEA